MRISSNGRACDRFSAWSCSLKRAVYNTPDRQCLECYIYRLSTLDTMQKIGVGRDITKHRVYYPDIFVYRITDAVLSATEDWPLLYSECAEQSKLPDLKEPRLSYEQFRRSVNPLMFTVAI